MEKFSRLNNQLKTISRIGHFINKSDIYIQDFISDKSGDKLKLPAAIHFRSFTVKNDL